MPGRWGAADRFPCPQCGVGTVHVTRRTVHPVLGPDYEVQTLGCSNCNYLTTRSVDREGQDAPKE